MSTHGISPANAERQPITDHPNDHPPLTEIVHKALMRLGMNSAIIPDQYTPEYQRIISSRDRKLRDVYGVASHLLLLGFKFDFGAFFLKEGSFDDLERMKKVVESLPECSSAALERALKVFNNTLDTEGLDVHQVDSKSLKETTMDRLSSNIVDLSWCNIIWSQLSSTGATRAHVVRLFVSIFMTAMRVRCPVQDFPSQWSTFGNTRTFDELSVMDLSASVRDKPEWRRKLQDDTIVSKWRAEAYDQGTTSSMFDFLLAELRWFSEEFDPETGIDYSTVPGVFFTNSLISQKDRDALCTGSNALAMIPENQKDWHPKSNGQVLNLVHPSLYPYVRGRTRRFLHGGPPPITKTFSELTLDSNDMDAVANSILRFLDPPPPPTSFNSPVVALATVGTGVVTSASMANADIVELTWRSDSNYQWLPVDVEISADRTRSARFLSYVNNLHPGVDAPGRPLYPIIERILSRFVPLFERTLTETRRRRTGHAGVRKQFLRDSVEEYWDPSEPDYDVLDASDTDTAYDEVRDNWIETRHFVRPVVGPFAPPSHPGPAIVTLGGRTIQVIIKMANVHLSPENPKYAGGSWHVEGTDNERIVATGIYYYESENISESSLRFRQAVEEPQYEPYEHEHLEELYGMTSGQYNDSLPANQDLGAIMTTEGRCICFPNGIQHRLSSFKLKDPTKSGHRKILVFFLVDPSQRILSTSDVPPQQVEWLLSVVRQQVGTRLSLLPPELFDQISEHVKAVAYTPLSGDGGSSSTWLMSLEEAKEHRLSLMDERADFAGMVNSHLYERRFNLCEH